MLDSFEERRREEAWDFACHEAAKDLGLLSLGPEMWEGENGDLIHAKAKKLMETMNTPLPKFAL